MILPLLLQTVCVCGIRNANVGMHTMLCIAAQVVMPPLLHSAQLKPDVHITDLESTSDNEDEDDEVRICLFATFELRT